MMKTLVLATAAVGFIALATPPAVAAAPDGALTCREAAKLKYPSDRKMRHEFRKACKQAWRAQKNAGSA